MRMDINLPVPKSVLHVALGTDVIYTVRESVFTPIDPRDVPSGFQEGPCFTEKTNLQARVEALENAIP